MGVSELSKKSYHELKDLGRKQRLVYDQLKIMERMRPSAQDIADALGWPINSITGRLSELKKFGFVEKTGTKISRMGTTVGTLCTIDPADKKAMSLLDDE